MSSSRRVTIDLSISVLTLVEIQYTLVILVTLVVYLILVFACPIRDPQGIPLCSPHYKGIATPTPLSAIGMPPLLKLQ